MTDTGWFARDLRGTRAKARKESEPIEDPALRIMMESWSHEGKAWSVGLKNFVFTNTPTLHYSNIPTWNSRCFYSSNAGVFQD